MDEATWEGLAQEGKAAEVRAVGTADTLVWALGVKFRVPHLKDTGQGLPGCD